MGAAQSTRKITLVDDDKAGVIKLSESLAQRLRGQIEGQQAAAAERPSPAAVQEPLPPPPPPPQAPVLLPAHPAFIERPLPVTPEPPKIPDVLPIVVVPEPPKVPEPLPPKVPEPPPPKVPEPPPPKVPEPLTPMPVLETIPQEVTPEPQPLGQPAAPASPPVAEAPQPLPSAIILPIPLQVEEPPAAFPQVETPATPNIDVAIKAGPGPTLAQPGGSIPPWSIYAEEAHLMVMRLREEKEQEIKKLNLEWRDKMDAREKEFTKIARLSEEEVSSALQEVENLFVKASCNPVCQNQQDVVMNCYQDHPRQSLRCAREVEHFTQCVDLSRLESIMKQDAKAH